MNNESDLLAELKSIKALLALGLVRDMETTTQKILALARLGFTPSELADLLDTTAGTVSVAISQAKSKKKTKQARPKPQAPRSEADAE